MDIQQDVCDVCVYVCLYVCMSVCMYVDLYVWWYVCVCALVHGDVSEFVNLTS